MEKYVRNFKKEGKLLKLYIKIPMFKKFADVVYYFRNKYDDGLISYLDAGLDITGKFVILNFVLRDKSDIEPYIKSYNKLKERIKNEIIN